MQHNNTSDFIQHPFDTFANIFLTKLEKDIVLPEKPIFYNRYVDDVINRRNTNTEDKLFNKINNYHHKIKFTTEENPTKFLDTAMLYILRSFIVFG